MNQLSLGESFKPSGAAPMKVYSCIAISGPSSEIGDVGQPLRGLYNDVDLFGCPDDCGEFPDTSGYESANFANFASDVEDCQLYPYMQKCLDVVTDRTNRRFERFCQQYPGQVEKVLHWPKFGGKVFAIAGFVKVYRHAITLVH